MKIRISLERCIKCMGCLAVCDVISSHAMDLIIDETKAMESCGKCKSLMCVKMCPTGAISIEE